MENRGPSVNLHRQHRSHNTNDDPENRRIIVRLDFNRSKGHEHSAESNHAERKKSFLSKRSLSQLTSSKLPIQTGGKNPIAILILRDVRLDTLLLEAQLKRQVLIEFVLD